MVETVVNILTRVAGNSATSAGSSHRTYSAKNLLLLPITLLLLSGCAGDWRTASREPAGMAPSPQTTKEAVLLVYGAPTFGWRGWFAIHTWIAAKRSDEPVYTVYEVIGWRLYRGLPALRIEKDFPDRYWYGEKPRLLKEFRGAGVDELIVKVDGAARAYPWPETYEAFPGPNSNTFTAWVGKQVPEMDLDLPFTAIGSGYAEKSGNITVESQQRAKAGRPP